MSNSILKKHTHDRFTIIDNKLLSNATLSWKANGILCYLLSMRNGWAINQGEISRHATDGTDAVKSGFKELKEAGFMRVNSSRENGKFKQHTTEVRESLDLPWDGDSSPQVENPLVDKTLVENPPLTSTNHNKNLFKQENNICATEVAPVDSSSKKSKDRATNGQVKQAFEKLWQYYPVKKGKQSAYKAFCKAAHGKTSRELEVLSKEVWGGVVGLLQEDRWLREIKEHEKLKIFIPELPNGSTWFNQQRWTDEHETDPVKFLENLKARSR